MTDAAFEAAARKHLPPLARLDAENADKVIRLWETILAESGWDEIGDCPYRPDVPGVSLAQHHSAVTDGALRLLETNDQYSDGSVTWDERLVVMAGITHDVSKLVEYEPDSSGGSRRSELGRNLQHAMYAVHHMLNLNFPFDVITIVAHHTPQSHWAPGSIEALAVVYADHALYDFYQHLLGLPILAK
jgi:hypothetical protein